MATVKIKVGLFLVALSWFSYTLYRFALSITGQIVSFTDVPGTIGLGFRSAGSFIAVVVILFYLVKRDLSAPEVIMSLRWIVAFEAIYFFCFLQSAIWGLATVFPGYPRELLIVSTGLPCLAEALVIPLVLTKLFLELNPKKAASGATKWALIAGTTYLFVFWFNYTMQWIAALMDTGVRFVLYPINAFGFALTAVGLLGVAFYAALSFRRTLGSEKLTGLGLRKIGVIVTAVGLYFDLMLLLYLLFGSVGGYNMWHTFFVYHNVYLWCLAFPVAGLPLLFQPQR